MATDLAYWLLLDFFVIEMKTVKDYIEAMDQGDFESRLKFTLRIRRVVLPIEIVISMIFRIIVCFKIFKT